MKDYKYIKFVLSLEMPKTHVFDCINKSSGGLIGTVKWYTYWQQYCYFPLPNTVYSKDCLEDIIDFIKNIQAEKDGEKP